MEGKEGYMLGRDGSNTLNYVVVELDTHSASAYIGLTNVGGDAAAASVHEAILRMRNGTLEL